MRIGSAIILVGLLQHSNMSKHYLIRYIEVPGSMFQLHRADNLVCILMHKLHPLPSSQRVRTILEHSQRPCGEPVQKVHDEQHTHTDMHTKLVH
jgi:hypothetical protein